MNKIYAFFFFLIRINFKIDSYSFIDVLESHRINYNRLLKLSIEHKRFRMRFLFIHTIIETLGRRGRKNFEIFNNKRNIFFFYDTVAIRCTCALRNLRLQIQN